MSGEQKSQYHSRAAPSVLGPPGFDPIPMLADTLPVFSQNEIREEGVKGSPGRVAVGAAVNVGDSPFKKKRKGERMEERNPQRLRSATKPLRCRSGRATQA